MEKALSEQEVLLREYVTKVLELQKDTIDVMGMLFNDIHESKKDEFTLTWYLE